MIYRAAMLRSWLLLRPPAGTNECALGAIPHPSEHGAQEHLPVMQHTSTHAVFAVLNHLGSSRACLWRLLELHTCTTLARYCLSDSRVRFLYVLACFVHLGTPSQPVESIRCHIHLHVQPHNAGLGERAHS